MASINRTAYNALVDDSGGGLDGSVWNKTAIKDVILDPIDALLSGGAVFAPTAYAVAWTGSGGTQPTIGNGTLAATYTRVGALVWVNIAVLAGTTTSGGSGSPWLFSMPSVAADTVPYVGPFSAFLQDAGSAYYSATGIVGHFSNSQIALVGNGTGFFQNGTPFTIANGDFIRISGWYVG